MYHVCVRARAYVCVRVRTCACECARLRARVTGTTASLPDLAARIVLPRGANPALARSEMCERRSARGERCSRQEPAPRTDGAVGTLLRHRSGGRRLRCKRGVLLRHHVVHLARLVRELVPERVGMAASDMAVLLRDRHAERNEQQQERGRPPVAAPRASGRRAARVRQASSRNGACRETHALRARGEGGDGPGGGMDAGEGAHDLMRVCVMPGAVAACAAPEPPTAVPSAQSRGGRHELFVGETVHLLSPDSRIFVSRNLRQGGRRGWEKKGRACQHRASPTRRCPRGS